jgi:outer membrane protein assembly factor BamB
MRVLLGGLLIFLLIGIFVGTTLIRNTLQPSSASVKWSFTRSHSNLDFSPIVVGGVMYVGFDDGWLYALNATSGTIKWSALPSGQGKEFLAPPTVVNDIVYISTKDGMLYALNAVSGATRWSVKIVPFLVSPLVVNGLVYVGRGFGGFDLTALDALSGKEKWTFHKKLKGSSISAPPTVENGIVYADLNDTLYALDASSGKELWSYTPDKQLRLVFAPVIANGIVYIGMYDYSLPRVKGRVSALDASSGKELWFYRTGRFITRSLQVINGMVYPIVELEDERTQLEALNARSGSRIWSFLPGKGYIHSLVVVGGMAYIYVAEVDILNVLDESSGIRKWSRNGILSSPLVVNGVVYVGFQNEMFSALDAHSGNTRWSISQWNNNQPLMVNGIIYLFSNFKIWAIQPPA